MNEQLQEKLLIVWSSADREVALNMLLMYTGNAQRNHWWEHITLLIWGPSQRLVMDDDEIRGTISELRQLGIRIIACKACADKYGYAGTLTDLGIEVFGTGPTLTSWLKSSSRVITF